MNTKNTFPHLSPRTCDILTQIPWHCGEQDCPVGWHQATYWVDSDSETGYTVDSYSDGDHEFCEESEVPSCEKVDAAWQRYYKDVARTGKDPLGAFMLPSPKKVKRVWQVRFSNSIPGPVLVGSRRRGRGAWEYDASKLPTELVNYLMLEVVHRAVFPEPMEALRGYAESDENVKVQRDSRYLKMLVTVEEEVPLRNPERMLRAKAREALAR